MRNILWASIFTLTLIFCASANAQKKHLIMFYNVENLFDTIHQENVRDLEFTPEGANKWTGVKYWKKMSNLEKVFEDVAKTNQMFPSVIGVSEIENRNVLEDLVSLKKLEKANYQIVHYDSPDARGVDVAFLYRPNKFKLQGSKAIKTVIEGMPNFRTRDILAMWGTIDEEKYLFMVAHWPSRIGGKDASSSKRCGAAKIMRHVADSVYNESPETKIIMMGDLNDDPTDESILKVLNAKSEVEELTKGDLFNPYCRMYKNGMGTLAYQDEWSLFDNIIVSENIINADQGTLHITPSKKKGYYGHIYKKPMILQKSGQYKGYPLRTFSGGNFMNGFSDHCPVYIILEK